MYLLITGGRCQSRCRGASSYRWTGAFCTAIKESSKCKMDGSERRCGDHLVFVDPELGGRGDKYVAWTRTIRAATARSRSDRRVNKPEKRREATPWRYRFCPPTAKRGRRNS
ncbi:uncharacterized protein LOC105432975 [Pogonomyrmex barbatus]|uniref:Uncharacterized protein LOC105432975 n=1 Tax=Pogonomyrmex barbatus TaxID=144034 RepID=A0A6I9WR51_9HYME|nr:uncharacterized protein LOC105432975 [Pogonomyrmex barbatus]